MAKQLEETEFTKDSLRSSLDKVSSKYTATIPLSLLFVFHNLPPVLVFETETERQTLKCMQQAIDYVAHVKLLVAFNFL